MAGVKRYTIKELQPDLKDALIIGIIINRRSMCSFSGKPTQYGEQPQRAVWNFTLRDSESDFVNVTTWGLKPYIEGLCSTFHIGHVVELVKPAIKTREQGDKNELFEPSVPSPFRLVMNEGIADIHTYSGPDRTKYVSLLALPTKNPSVLQALNVVMRNLDELKDSCVDLMVVVMHFSPVGNTRNRKDGKEMIYRDIEVNDGSLQFGETLRLWDPEWVERAEFWQPRHTVLFLADVPILFNAFKKQYCLTIGRRTMITENPNIPRTQIARAATRNLPESISRSTSGNLLNSTNSSGIMTIRQIGEHLDQESQNSSSNKVQFSVVVIAVIDQMNLDIKSILATICGRCSRPISQPETSCKNPDCPSVRGTESRLTLSNFNLRVNISDFTGKLMDCRLVGKPAEDLLKCNVEEFKAMSNEDRDSLKWQFLMERCKIGLHVVCSTPLQKYQTIYNIRFIKRIQQIDESECSGSTGLIY